MAALDMLPGAYTILKDARRLKTLEATAQINREMAALQAEFDSLVVRAHNEGNRIATIAQVMGASRNTVYASLERAAAPTFKDIDPLLGRYSIEGDKIRITLNEAEVVALVADWGIDAATVAQAGRDGLFTALFAQHNGDWFPENLGTLHVGGKMRHPVGYWFDSEENRAELRGWAAKVGASEGGAA